MSSSNKVARLELSWASNAEMKTVTKQIRCCDNRHKEILAAESRVTQGFKVMKCHIARDPKLENRAKQISFNNFHPSQNKVILQLLSIQALFIANQDVGKG